MATEADKTNTAIIGTVVLVGAFMMITISALLALIVRTSEREIDERAPTHADLETVRGVKRAQRAKLAAAPGWADEQHLHANVPLDQAKALVLKEFRATPAAASPVAPVAAGSGGAGGASATVAAAGGAAATARGVGGAPTNAAVRGTGGVPAQAPGGH
jgi:hypothetical protein